VKRDIISVLDMERDLADILRMATRMKDPNAPESSLRPLEKMTVGMIFEKSSTRTRVSFEIGVRQLGGHAIFLNKNDIQMGRGETVHDTAKVLSRYVDMLVYRAYRRSDVVELARHASVPVINALDDMEHPCQIAADLLTVLEHKGGLAGKVLAYLGDGNNVCNSLLLGGALMGMEVRAACPRRYTVKQEFLEKAQRTAKRHEGKVLVTEDPAQAAKGADVLYTDTWVSMGDEAEAKARKEFLTPYRIGDSVVDIADKDCIIMHCLPAHRGEEITDDVIDGPHSVVFDQAENRLHVQKAIMAALIKG